MQRSGDGRAAERWREREEIWGEKHKTAGQKKDWTHSDKPSENKRRRGGEGIERVDGYLSVIRLRCGTSRNDRIKSDGPGQISKARSGLVMSIMPGLKWCTVHLCKEEGWSISRKCCRRCENMEGKMACVRVHLRLYCLCTFRCTAAPVSALLAESTSYINSQRQEILQISSRGSKVLIKRLREQHGLHQTPHQHLVYIFFHCRFESMSLSFQDLLTPGQRSWCNFKHSSSCITALSKLITMHNEVRSAVRMSWPKCGRQCLGGGEKKKKTASPSLDILVSPRALFQGKTETNPPFMEPYHGKSWGQCSVPRDRKIEESGLLACLKPQLYSWWYPQVLCWMTAGTLRSS